MWEKNLPGLPIYCKYRYIQPLNCPLNCNSKKVIYLSECKKCKNPYVGKAQTKFRMRLNNYKSAHKSFKTKKRETQKLFHGHYIQDDHEGKDDWQFTLTDQCTLMLNLGRERFIGNIVLKRSIQMALMSVKNLVYNKLTRQNIFCFFNSISILVILTSCYHYSHLYYYYYYFYYYYHYHYYFYY